MLRDYQSSLANQAAQILRAYGIVYMAFEMRVGKTLTSLQTAANVGAKSVLFVTTKKARKSIEDDFSSAGLEYVLDVVSYGSLCKIGHKYDVYIADEAHNFGAYPKMTLRTQRMKQLVGNSYLILLSGTPTPESYSQIFHQFGLSDRTPFDEKNFYKWAKAGYVNIRQVKRNGLMLNDYKNANIYLIQQKIQKYMLNYTQEQAGFEQKEIIEKIIRIKTDNNVNNLMNHLLRHKVYKFKQSNDCILCDTAVQLMQKLHQLGSGTVITENKEYMVLDTAKAEYIRENYNNKKIAIFYKFIAERKAIENIIGKDKLIESPEGFNLSEDKIFISQIKSGALGINLSSADILIFYNIDFSSQLYWQARERIQSLNRDRPAIVHWLFSESGIENKIYDRVIAKKDFTTFYFRKEYLTQC